MHVRIAIVAASAAAATLCRADILPVEGHQSMSGKISVVSGGTTMGPVGFNLSAPDPLVSWSPPAQDLSLALGGASAHIVGTYASSIGPEAITLTAGVHIDGAAGTGNACIFEWSREFQVRFEVTTPGVYNVSGEVRRVRAGWAAPIYPASFSLSAFPPPPTFVSLQLFGVPLLGGPPAVATHGPVLLFLAPGTYIAQASDHSTQIASIDTPNSYDSTVTVSISEACYADCDLTGTLTVADFGCFQTRFVAGDPYADCNADGVRTVADFGCFQTKYVAGCP